MSSAQVHGLRSPTSPAGRLANIAHLVHRVGDPKQNQVLGWIEVFKVLEAVEAGEGAGDSAALACAHLLSLREEVERMRKEAQLRGHWSSKAEQQTSALLTGDGLGVQNLNQPWDRVRHEYGDGIQTVLEHLVETMEATEAVVTREELAKLSEIARDLEKKAEQAGLGRETRIFLLRLAAEIRRAVRSYPIKGARAFGEASAGLLLIPVPRLPPKDPERSVVATSFGSVMDALRRAWSKARPFVVTLHLLLSTADAGADLLERVVDTPSEVRDDELEVEEEQPTPLPETRRTLPAPPTEV